MRTWREIDIELLRVLLSSLVVHTASLDPNSPLLVPGISLCHHQPRPFAHTSGPIKWMTYVSLNCSMPLLDGSTCGSLAGSCRFRWPWRTSLAQHLIEVVRPWSSGMPSRFES